jgi:FkbM family methyltransferase
MKSMLERSGMQERAREVRLPDGTRVACLKKIEALVLDDHIDGYFRHGIRVREGDIVIDVGANIGLFGLRAMQRCRGQATVLSFEPIPVIFSALSENAERFGQGRWRAFPFGLSSRRRTARFVYYPGSPAMSTSYPEAYNNLLSKSVRGTWKSAPPHLWWMRLLPSPVSALVAKSLRANGEPMECELRTLSDVIAEYGVPRIDLLKVDAEGEELEVLRGVDPADWGKINQIVVEVHDVEGRLRAITELLREHGFRDQVIDKERAFDELPFFNVYATRTPAST